MLKKFFDSCFMFLFIAAVLIFGGLYFVFSFAAWEFNPGNWTEFARFTYLIVSLCFYFFALCAVLDSEFPRIHND